MAQRTRHTFPGQHRPKTAPFQSTRPFVVKDVRPKVNSEIGRGAYGSVSLYALEGVTCAGKQVHETLAGDEGLKVVEKFDKECSVLAKLSHPNVVQFMGIHIPPQPRLPVLLMELLSTDLHSLLLNKPNIPLSLKLSLLADVARGLRYLHSHKPQIVHRDLSAKNVLLDSTLVAKIGDLGNVRFIELTPDQASSLSHVPGTTIYMPPEAFEISTETTKRVYNASLDMFSFGHLALFTATQVFPSELLPQKYQSRGGVMLGRSEVDRRERYFEILNQMKLQNLNELIRRCLSDTPRDRPTAEELEAELEAMKEQQCEDKESHSFRIHLMKELKDMESSRHHEDKVQAPQLAAENTRLQSMLTELRHLSEEQMKVKDKQLCELHEAQAENKRLQAENRRLQSVITDLCHDTEEQLKGKDDQICELRIEIESKESQTRELESQVERLESQVERLESEAEEMREQLANTFFTSKELDEKNQELRELQEDYEEKIRLVREQKDVRDWKIKWLHEEMEKLEANQTGPGRYDKLEWSSCADLPVAMEDPQGVLLGEKLYVGGGWLKGSDGPRKICIYNFPAKSWTVIDGPARHSALAVYKDDLVLIGGKQVQQDTTTSQIMTLQDGSDWKEQLPPMPTPRSGASAVGVGDHLIVVGGDKHLDTVEVYNGQIWASATPLLKPCSRAKLLVSNNVLFVVGGLTPSFLTKGRMAMCTKLSSLLAPPPSPPTAAEEAEATRRNAPPHNSEVSWNALEPLPCRYSGIAKYCGSVLAVGGFTYFRRRYESDIYIYVPVSNRWVKIGKFPVAVSNSCAVTLPSGDIMVLGGCRGNELTQSVFRASTHTED